MFIPFQIKASMTQKSMFKKVKSVAVGQKTAIGAPPVQSHKRTVDYGNMDYMYIIPMF